ncbi:MAG TPA: VanZ family protein [Gemmatimonadales bacterium]|jgi:VanZ family protein
MTELTMAEIMNDGSARAPITLRRAWIAVGVWLVFQLTLTTLPGNSFPEMHTFFRLDWTAHFCMYFGLAVLLTRVARASGWPARALFVVWGAILLLGALDELHQLFIPSRDCEFGDWVMDASGGGCGLLVGTFLARTRWAAFLMR